MKKVSFLFAAVMLFVSNGVQAQENSSDPFLFNHLGAGVSIGLDGIGVELATPVTPYLGLRAGVSFYPTIKVNVDDIDYTRNDKDGEAEVKTKFSRIEGKLLMDVYPFGNKLSLHLTGGFFVGKSDWLTATLIEDPNAEFGGGIRKMIGNEQWNVRAVNHEVDLRLTTNSFKPYLGIGFGRMVPKPGKRVGVSCDIGVQFHGKPQLEGYATVTTAYNGDLHKWVELEADDFDFGEDFHDDIEDVLDVVHKVKVWPVLNVRITGRIF